MRERWRSALPLSCLRTCSAPASAPSSSRRSGNKADALGASRRQLRRGVRGCGAGATYAECRVVEAFNEKHKHMRVVLGSTALLSTSAFLQSVAARAEAKKATGRAA